MPEPPNRAALVAELLARLDEYDDAALAGVLVEERRLCPRCGRRARRQKTMPGDVPFVVLRCACGWTRTRVDPDPPARSG